MAPPPLSDLLDWRVPYVEVLAMISVSRVYACDSLLDGLRAPPSTGWPSPAAMANGATQTASTMLLARIQRRLDMRVSSLRRGLPYVSPTGPGARGRARTALMSRGRRASAR